MRWIILVILLSLSAVSLPAAGAAGAVPSEQQRFSRWLHTNLAQVAGDRIVPQGEVFAIGSGAWSYFTDPRAVSTKTSTITGWITRNGYVQVASFDHQTRRLVVKRMPRRIGRDDHNNPAFTIRPDGRIMVFYSPHSGRDHPTHGKSRLYYATTIRPGDLGQWGRTRTVSVNVPGRLGFTYPSPISIGKAGVWLAWRGGNWLPTRSLNKHGHWKKARNIVLQYRRGRRPYAKYAPGANGKIHMAYTEQNPGQGRTNVFYASISPNSDRVTSANGRPLAKAKLPFRVKQGEKVYSYKTQGRAWVMDVADDNGKPLIAYLAGFGKNKGMTFRYARWDGATWNDQFVTLAHDGSRSANNSYGHNFASGGITIDHSTPNRLFISRGVNRHYQVEVWTYEQAANTWQTKVVSPPHQSCFRPVGSTGANHGIVFFLCGQHSHWTKFHTRILAATY